MARALVLVLVTLTLAPPAWSDGRRSRGRRLDRVPRPASALRLTRAIVTAPLSAALVAPKEIAGGIRASRRGSDYRGAPVPRLRDPAGLLRWALHVGADIALLRLLRATVPTMSAADLRRADFENRRAMRPAWQRDPASFHHPEPPALRPTGWRELGYLSPHRHQVEIDWRSGYQPHPDMPGSARWLGHGFHDGRAFMTRFRSPGERAGAEVPDDDGDRNLIVYVHGSMQGAASDMRVAGIERMAEELGANAAEVVAPFHGERTLPRSLPVEGLFTPRAEDFRNGIAQAVFEIRQVISWYRARNPRAKIAVVGISLGAYTAAVLAGLEPRVDAVVAVVPHYDVAGAFTRLPEMRRATPEQIARFTEVVAPVSPSRLPPVVAPDRLFIYAGMADRVTGASSARQLADRWGISEESGQLAWGNGGHLEGRRVNQWVARQLTALGFDEPPRPIARRAADISARSDEQRRARARR